MSNNAVLFDLDGTLVDLRIDIEDVRGQLAELFAPLGYTTRFAPILERIAQASAQVSNSESERVDLHRRGMGLLDAAELAAADTADAVAGAVTIVAHLVDASVPVAIITNNSRGCVAPALATIGLGAVPWVTTVSRDDAPAKPNPTGVTAAARSLLPEGGTVWLVGDGDRDIEAAMNANALLSDIDVVSVGLLRESNEARLRAASPDHVIDDLALLAGLLGLDPVG